MSPVIRTLLPKLLFWLTLEIILNLVGLDNLADYSEFISNKMTGNITKPVMVQVS